MRISRTPVLLLAGIGMIGAAACVDNELTNPEDTRVSVVMTGAPGTVENLWVNLSGVTLVDDQGQEVALLTEAIGPIEVTALAEEGHATLAVNVTVPSGDYSDLRFHITGAAIETEAGEILTYGTITLPDGRAATGTLQCQACDQGPVAAVIPRVTGEEAAIDLRGGSIILVVDFDVPLSVEPPPPGGGQWGLDPTLHLSEASSLLRVVGDVVLASGVTVPECPAGTARDVGYFIPLARAVTFRDADGNPLVRSGVTNVASTFEIDFLQMDQYDLDHVEEVVVDDDWKLVFDASPLPTRVVPENTAVRRIVAQYTIESVTCEAR